MLQNGKIKGLIFDCYKTLIDIKTDEGSRETNESVSKWLLYQGVRIEPDILREEYKWKVINRLSNSGQRHPDIRIEEIFAEICAENAFKEIDPHWLGIETAKVFNCVFKKTGGLSKESAPARKIQRHSQMHSF